METSLPVAWPVTPGTYEDQINPLADLPDLFGDVEPPVPWVALVGNTYPVKKALESLEAPWDKEQCDWLIAAGKVAQARVITDHQQHQEPAAAASKEAQGEA